MRGEPGTFLQRRQGFLQVVLGFGQLGHVSLLLRIVMEGASLRLKINIFGNYRHAWGTPEHHSFLKA